MKNSKIIVVLLFIAMYFICGITAMYAQTTTTQATHHTISKNCDFIYFSLPWNATVEIVAVKGTRLVVEQKISYSGQIISAVAEYWKKQGRYSLERQIDEPMSRVFYAHKITNYLISRDKKMIEEKIHYKIMVPSNKEIIIMRSKPLMIAGI